MQHLMPLRQKRESRGHTGSKSKFTAHKGRYTMAEGMQVKTNRSLTGFETLLLCSVIRPIVGVCSIQ